MTREGYEKIEQWFLARPICLSLLKFLNHWLTLIVFCSYPIILAFLAYLRDERLIRAIAVPAFVFSAVTVMRRVWSHPRPYETLEIHPLIPRNKKGQSFPSRHVASVTIITLACFYVWLPLGIAMSVIAVCISVIRPIAGIHFPKDIVAGVLFSLIVGIIGFWLI